MKKRNVTKRRSLSELMRATAMPPEATIAINNFAAARAYMYGTVYGEHEASDLTGRGRSESVAFPEPRNDRYWKVRG